MIMNMKRNIITLAFTALFIFLPIASADAQTQKTKPKTRKALLRENELLVKKVESLQEELEWLKNDINEKDSLRNELIELYKESENNIAAGLLPEDYTGEVTDSLLSIWYLHRQANSNKEGTGYDMDSVHFTSNVPDKVMIERLEKMNSFITLPYNETVKNYMILYSEKMPSRMSQILGLAAFYMPIFEETFIKYDMPVELKYMAIIESALNPRAVSWAGAKGMWQFIYSTGKNYGLRINSYVDERLDPWVSVDAAARYLKDAYRIFGDWSLAISSYNCGSGNVNKAIKKAGGKRDFWSIYPYLPRETRGYVPAMVGAMYAIRYAKEYSLEPAPVMMPAHVDTFHIHKNLHLRQISEVIGIPLNEVRDLNPQYYRDVVPGNEGDFILRLPFNYATDFIDKQDTVYKHRANEIFKERVDVDRSGNGSGQGVSSGRTSSGSAPTYVTYTVRSGDSLGKIAARYHVTISQIKSWNHLKSNTIRVGQRLRIRRAGSSSAQAQTRTSAPQASSSAQKPASTASSGDYTVYTVKKGDTLYKISRQFPGTTPQEIMRYNGITEAIRAGMKLKIPKK